MATCGLLAGAKAIIQPLTLVLPTPAWAVPVLAATSSWEGKPTPEAVPVGHDVVHEGRDQWAAVPDEVACFQGVGW
jgi:hypothetical protein